MSTNAEAEDFGGQRPGALAKFSLVEEVAATVAISRQDAAIIVEVIFDSMVLALQRGDRIEIRGFGTFGIRNRGPRAGRNPKTGEPVAITAKRVAFFALSRRLGKILNEI